MELEHFITRARVEWAYKEAKLAQHDRRRERWARQAERAAKARDARMLMALQKGADILQRMSEEQFGQHGRDFDGYVIPATEFQLWRNAYTSMDKGDPEMPYIWIYVAAGILAGLIA